MKNELFIADMTPVMVEGFEEKFVTPGDTFELRCKAKGSPLPEVFWRIDGDHLYKSERHKISSKQNVHETEAVLQVRIRLTMVSSCRLSVLGLLQMPCCPSWTTMARP